MNFEHSPGLPGYGKRGLTGVDGLQGQSIYFTDYDPELNFIAIENAIRNNEVLWSTAPPGTKLPGGKKYMTGDLFISSFGAVYEIDAELDEFAITDGVLLKSQFFSTYHEYTSNGFKRWFNVHDASKFLIDNNLSGLYYSLPNSFYVAANDYNRIEYTDGSAFTMYSLASIPSVDDQKALAIVKTSSGFGIGNKASTIRNINLMFDVASLKKSHTFTTSTPEGTIISNREIDTNALFDPLFDPSTIDVSAVATGANSIRVYWDISQFASSYGSAKIHFYKDVTVADISDPSLNTEFVLHINDNTGNVNITGLDASSLYYYGMDIYVNGWKRSGLTYSVYTEQFPAPIPPVIFLVSAVKTTNTTTTWRFTSLASGGSGSLIYELQSATDYNTGSAYTWNTFSPPIADPSVGVNKLLIHFDSAWPSTWKHVLRVRVTDAISGKQVYSNELLFKAPYP